MLILSSGGSTGYELFINGQSIGSSEDWTTTDSYTFVAACDAPTVYVKDPRSLTSPAIHAHSVRFLMTHSSIPALLQAFDAYDLGGIASVMGDFSHCGENIITGTHWKCKVHTAAHTASNKPSLVDDPPRRFSFV